jgi:hypothetical protein
LLSYSDVVEYLAGWLTGLGYDPLPVFDPGPGVDTDAIDVSPGRLVLLTLGSGAGYDVEMVFDRPAVFVRTVGNQMDYADAEKLAFDVDAGLTFPLDHSQLLGDKWLLSVVRAGGGPALLLKDDGDRYHFTCSYIMEVAV